MSINIVLSGSSGRVGVELKEIINQSSELSLVLGLDSKNTFNELTKTIKADVLIDFSNPIIFSEVLAWSVKNKISFVSGTTGITTNQQSELKEASNKIPVLWSSNMSLGIQFFHKILEEIKNISWYDFQIEEAHHKFKKDHPSGTAITLNEKLKSVLGRDMPDPLSIRGGGIFGSHKLWMMDSEETITIKHMALNRKVFAKGAIAAAKWIYKKNAGLYTMKDVFET